MTNLNNKYNYVSIYVIEKLTLSWVKLEGSGVGVAVGLITLGSLLKVRRASF